MFGSEQLQGCGQRSKLSRRVIGIPHSPWRRFTTWLSRASMGCGCASLALACILWALGGLFSPGDTTINHVLRFVAGCMAVGWTIFFLRIAWELIFKPEEHWLYAISTQGIEKWTRIIPQTTGALFFAPEGRVCVETARGMRCFDTAGTPVACPAVDTLRPATATKIAYTARLPENSIIELPASNPFIQCTFDNGSDAIATYREGELVWRLGKPSRCQLTGMIFTPNGNTLVLWHKSGNELGDVLWIVNADGEIIKCVEHDEVRVILPQPDGTILYFLAEDGRLVKLSASAEELWMCETDTTKYGSPPAIAVAPDGIIYVLLG